MTQHSKRTRSLPERLGLKDPGDARVLGRPVGFRQLDEVPDHDGSLTPVGFLIAFVTDCADVCRVAPHLVGIYGSGGHLWLAYPKRSGSIPTDISRDSGWEPLLEAGFLPVSQVAVDETWSALRFRRREEIKKLTRKQELPGR